MKPWYTHYPGTGILQDKQEKLPWIAPALQLAGIEVTYASMSSGDYGWISNGVRYLVEAKWSASDFFGSLFSGRLKSQLQRCLVEADRVFLAIPSVMNGLPADWTGKSVEATFCKLQCWGVQVIHEPTAPAVVQRLVTLYKSSLATWPLEGQERVYKVIREGTPTERALRSFRIGVGPQAAATLTNKFGTFARITAASEAQLQETVGKVVGTTLWNTLHMVPKDERRELLGRMVN